MEDPKKVESFNEYLALFEPGVQSKLIELREIVLTMVPEAEETISYQIPTFKFHGLLVSIGAARKHCALYMLNTTTIEKHKAQLKRFNTSKSAVRFPLNEPIPAKIVEMLVSTRMKENLASTNK